MKYRRPQDFDTAVRMLRACVDVTVTGKQQMALQDAIRRLFEIDWYNDAMRPLYHANVVCQLVMNSLVPIVQELIFDERVFREHEAAKDSTAESRYGEEYDRMRVRMVAAAPLRKQRHVTPEFEVMAAAMERYASDVVIQKAIRDVFCLLKTARTAFRLVCGRINDALENHNEILKSDDIPFEALSL